ncbi:MAG: OmpA family protein [Calditrichaeota bacterium]|nr:OmpA family protein [Calditrichota bacterium]
MKKHTILLRRILFFAVFCAFVLFQLNVFGQDITGSFGISGFGSMVKMVGGSVDRSTIDQWAGTQFRYGYSNLIMLNGSLGYGWVRARDPQGSQFVSVGGFKTLLVPMNFSAQYFFRSDSRLRTYLTAGAGMTLWAIRKMGSNTSALSLGKAVGGNELTLTFLGGAGIEYFISPRYSVRCGFQYHQLIKGNEDTIGFGDDGNDGIIELTLGFSHFWRTYRDFDRDNIDDRYDLDPLHPEDVDGFQDDDGAPDYDNDGDGIPDIMDGAPNQAEDIDGFQDDDGIPDPDNDNDGIPDIEDKCPNTPEDIDQFDDSDGCPDYDNDGDGIPDSLDQCPNWPEDFNDYQDEDGCPDEKPQAEALKIGEKIVSTEIRFYPANQALRPESFIIVDKIFNLLNQYPDMEIEIRSHTDTMGAPHINLRLSRQRAESIKDYLVKRGIQPSRITALGFGGTNPVADNKTPEGRAANRRIEFVRVK